MIVGHVTSLFLFVWLSLSFVRRTSSLQLYIMPRAKIDRRWIAALQHVRSKSGLINQQKNDRGLVMRLKAALAARRHGPPPAHVSRRALPSAPAVRGRRCACGQTP